MTVWLAGDHHFGHRNLVESFKDSTGSRPARPFLSIEAHDAELVRRHNEVVKPTDHVWFLGDLCMPSQAGQYAAAQAVRAMHGTLHILLGNHDQLDPTFYWSLGFKSVWGSSYELRGLLLSHIPVAPWSCQGRVNVHGHVHDAMPARYRAEALVRGVASSACYVNASLERTGYAPITIERARQLGQEARHS